jgi:hypothetical protein
MSEGSPWKSVTAPHWWSVAGCGWERAGGKRVKGEEGKRGRAKARARIRMTLAFVLGLALTLFTPSPFTLLPSLLFTASARQ